MTKAERDKKWRLAHPKESAAHSKKWKDNNKEKVKKTAKEWYVKNKLKQRDYQLQYDYNITLEEYNKLFEKQNGNCAICGKHQSEFKRIFDVEHCHATGKVRGLTCYKCNLLLSNANDNITILQSAINYLQASI